MKFGFLISVFDGLSNLYEIYKGDLPLDGEIKKLLATGVKGTALIRSYSNDILDDIPFVFVHFNNKNLYRRPVGIMPNNPYDVGEIVDIIYSPECDKVVFFKEYAGEWEALKKTD